MLTTIGYESAPTDAVFAALREAGVDLLVDVRAVVSSRRPGFSKTPLQAGLKEHGIEYQHLRGLGTPKAGRLASHAGDREAFERIYAEQIRTDAAQNDLATLIELMKTHCTVCLMCFEHDPAHCHRTLVAEAVEQRTGAPFRHLVPKLTRP